MTIETLFDKKIESVDNFIFFNKDSTHQKQHKLTIYFLINGQSCRNGKAW